MEILDVDGPPFHLIRGGSSSTELKVIRMTDHTALVFVLDCLNYMIRSTCKNSLPTADMNLIHVLLHDFTFVRNLLEDVDDAQHANISALAHQALEELDPFVANVLQKENHAFHLPALKLGYFKKRMMQMQMQKAEQYSFSRINSSHQMSFGMEERIDLVGLEDEVLKLKDQLTGGRQQLEVIALVGMGGIGKTTLAKHLFNDVSITYHFHIRASACVTREYRRRDVLFGLLSSISEDKDKIKSSSDDNILQELLYKHLKGHRYLIVIDDLWSLDAWEDLKPLLPNDGNGSRILVTTRLNDVISCIRPQSTPHVLRFLTQEQSWDLLRQQAFGNREECPSDLSEVGREIAATCGGLPLAIVVVAGLLAKNVKLEFWMEVCVRLDSYVGNSQQIMDILALSYEHLPRHLRCCFLYFRALPEDSDVLVNRLIWLWIAEGFVHPVEEKVIENVAESYLMNLVDRNLIVVHKKNMNGTIRICRMHDMLRQLCSIKAEEMNLYQPSSCYSRDASSSTPMISSHDRCFHSHDFHDISETTSCAPNIRAPFCYVEYEGSKQIRTSYVYKFVRVLNLCSLLLFAFPLEILQLFYLRFLELWVQKLENLPTKISNLWNLESLIITKEEGLGGVTITFSIWKMTKLRHLRISDEVQFGKPRPYDMGYPNVLNELQTLSALKLSHLHKHAEEVLNQTPNLKKLTFYRGPFKKGKFHFPNLSSLMHLESLKFSENSWQPTRTSIPGPHYFPHGLKKLILSGGHMDWKEISNLGKLQSLEVLKLRRNCFYGAEWRTEEGDFARLKFLKLSWMDLKQWNTCDSHFPNLQHLVLERCKYLEEIPISLGAIPTLHLIEVHGCGQSTLDSAKRIQQEQEEMGNDELQVLGHIVHNQFDECQVM
ncbi:putative late blight resistance protein homolog R1A-3 [Henckelia pumila]|uniref:putative late blight resistance protein homolog R1A-3 n=1 Tax=Henckelia pumila TaxID=405737 RepID=UPI003C6E9BA0